MYNYVLCVLNVKMGKKNNLFQVVNMQSTEKYTHTRKLKKILSRKLQMIRSFCFFSHSATATQLAVNQRKFDLTWKMSKTRYWYRITNICLVNWFGNCKKRIELSNTSLIGNQF